MSNITLPRATAQQALEALEAFLSDELRPYEAAKTSDALRAALAQEAEPVALKHRHEWFRTGGMEPGQFRCIHCGVWAKETAHD